jgi:hypothetical protein
MSIEPVHRKLLEKILASNEFVHSKIYQTFLTFLFESTLQARELKETTIAIEVFGKDASFNPMEDTIVRSHTYTLRKKLETYYYNEGRQDKLRLAIPKGHYSVICVPASDDRVTPRTLIRKARHRIPLLIIAALVGLCAALWLHGLSVGSKLKSYRMMDPGDPFWGDYLQSDLPVMLVVGDHFFISDSIAKYGCTVSIRHPKVNSIDDFRALYPNLSVEAAPEPYFPYHSLWSLPPIVSMLYSVKAPYVLRKSSDVTPQMLDEYNILYLGSIKTLYCLKYTLRQSHFRFEIAPHRVLYAPPGTDSTRVFETSLHSTGPNDDLVLAVKLPGPDDNSIFIIASYHSLGVPEAVGLLTSQPRLQKLESRFRERFGKVPRYFEILFRVTGIDKTAYGIEILAFNPLPAER